MTQPQLYHGSILFRTPCPPHHTNSLMTCPPIQLSTIDNIISIDPLPSQCDAPLELDPPQTPTKKPKTLSIGGLTVSLDRKTDGTGRTVPCELLPWERGSYAPQNTYTPLLKVSKIVDPAIFYKLMQDGGSLEALIRQSQWTRTAKNDPMSAKSEALALARPIHLFLLDFNDAETPFQTHAFL